MSGKYFSQRVGSLAVVGLIAITIVDNRLPAQTTNFPALGQEVVKLVEQRFYRADEAAAWVTQHGNYAAGIQSRDEFTRETKRVLRELKTSHTDYYSPDEYAYYGIWSIFAAPLRGEPREIESIGVELDAENFVRWVLPGGPADQAGLCRGIQLLQVGGQPFHQIHSFRGQAGKPVELQFRQTAQGDLERVQVTPQLVVPQQEWLAAQRAGAKVVEHQGRRVAYVSLYSCAGKQPLELLRELLGDSLNSAEALIIDFRFGWGGCPLEFVNLFNRQPPLLETSARDGTRMINDGQWRKPVVLLINGGSRSGKEAVAFSLKKHGLARLVGQRTAGAVVAGSCFRLADDSLLYLAVLDVKVDGERLEGVGVKPDVEVADEYRFNPGADPQRDRALDEAVRLLRSADGQSGH